jgi:phosphoglycolate phosphatase-like HAD superfamily hydrolase
MKLAMKASSLPWSGLAAPACAPIRCPRGTTPRPSRPSSPSSEKSPGEGSPDFVPPAERIAVFDNDGTLWAEQPMYFQAFFIFDRIKALAPATSRVEGQGTLRLRAQGRPESRARRRRERPAGNGDGHPRGHDHRGVRENPSPTGSPPPGIPKTGKPYTEMVYQPMLELLAYLRANGFKTFIVSGGGIDFMRPWAEKVYGIPPEQVIGSSIKAKYELRDGKPVIVKLPELNFIDDKAGKPVGIHQHIGRRPIIAAGNSDGDFEMLEWTTSRAGALRPDRPSHDAGREFAYDRESHIGKLDKGLDEGPQRGWTIVSMKNDWKN